MKGHGEKKARNQERAIAALLSNSSIPDAAKAANISGSTLYRWLKDSDFQGAYRKARKLIVQQAVAQIQNCIGLAVSTLKTIMKDEEAPASSRVSAAKTVIEMGLKATEIQELEARLEALESKL